MIIVKFAISLLGGENIMAISLIKSESKDAEIIHAMQIKSFMPLLEKYKDYETSPVNESIEKLIEKINQSFTDYYIIKHDSLNVGGVRIVKKNDKHYRVSIIFILPEYQGNCHLYEKVGYKQTGETKVINDRLTLVFYKKNHYEY